MALDLVCKHNVPIIRLVTKTVLLNLSFSFVFFRIWFYFLFFIKYVGLLDKMPENENCNV